MAKASRLMLPIAIIIPHAGLAIPPELQDRLALTPEQIFNEADIYIEQIFDFRDDVLHWVHFPFARAVVDVNRPENPALNRPGDGIVKWQTSYGDATYAPEQIPDEALERELISRYWHPWHKQLDEITRDERVKLVIDAHSMAAVGPNKYDDPGAKRPCVSVSNMGDENGNVLAMRERITAPAELTRWLAHHLGQAFAKIPPLTETELVGKVNTPFWGGWDIIAHGGHRQPWYMIEVNRALYVGAQTSSSPIVPPNAGHIQQLRQTIWHGLIELVSIV
jgi:N-formylglutamate amidohydrolase